MGIGEIGNADRDADRIIRFAGIDVFGRISLPGNRPGSRTSRELGRIISRAPWNRNYAPQPEQPPAPPDEMVQVDFRRAKSKSWIELPVPAVKYSMETPELLE